MANSYEIKIGASGEFVEQYQTILQKLNFYQGNIDGEFGPNTESAVKEYQSNLYLESTGVLTSTQQAYLDFDFKFSSGFILPDDQYIKAESEKTGITLHHIAGWAKRRGGGNSVSYFWGWKDSDRRVGTAFSIGLDGTIYTHFDPKYWIFHLGLKGTNGVFDKSSVGIELANEGELFKSPKGNWKFWAGKYNRDDKPIKKIWRGGEYWAPYTEAQIESTAKLTIYLQQEFGIKNEFVDKPFEYQPKLTNGKIDGVFTHANIRNDKTDISPAFDWDDYLSKCRFFQKYINVSESEPVIEKIDTSNIGVSSDYTVEEALEISKKLNESELELFISEDEDRKTFLGEFE